jgi:hypothetical protein
VKWATVPGLSIACNLRAVDLLEIDVRQTGHTVQGTGHCRMWWYYWLAQRGPTSLVPIPHLFTPSLRARTVANVCAKCLFRLTTFISCLRKSKLFRCIEVGYLTSKYSSINVGSQRRQRGNRRHVAFHTPVGLRLQAVLPWTWHQRHLLLMVPSCAQTLPTCINWGKLFVNLQHWSLN